VQTVHLPELEQSPQVALPGPCFLTRTVVDAFVLHQHVAAWRGRVFLVDNVGQHLAAADAAAEEHVGVHEVQAGLIDDKALVTVLNAIGEGMARDGFPLQRKVLLGRVPWKPK